MFNVKDYGAIGDAQADDSCAIDAAICAAERVGGDLFFPTGDYRVTRKHVIGYTRWTSYEEYVSRTRPLTGSEQTALEDPNSITPNAQTKAIGIKADGLVHIIADFTAPVLTPVIEYNTTKTLGSAAIRGNIRIVPPEFFDGKAYTRGPRSVPPRNLIGWMFTGTGARHVDGISAAGLDVGLLSIGMFWSNMENLTFEYCKDCCSATIATATRLSTIDMWYSDRGLVYDGASAYVGQVHTQEVGQDLVIFAAECCDLQNFYFEDVQSDNGDGLYAVTLGQNANEVGKINNSQLNSVRVGSTRPNKRGFRFHGTSGVTLMGCREYSHGVDADAISRALLIGTDFADTPQLPADRFPRLP